MLFGVPSNRRVTFFCRALDEAPFQKAATTYGQQVALLQQRGMIIDDVSQARFY